MFENLINYIREVVHQDLFISAFAFLVALDFILAFLSAYKEGRLRSKTCADGLYKSIGEVILICVLVIINSFATDLNIGLSVRMFIIMFIAKEGISVIANFRRLGVWIPSKLEDALNAELNKNTKGE